jgi:hypothetical protein
MYSILRTVKVNSRSLFPEGWDAFFAPLRVIALFVAIIVFSVVSPSWVLQAVAGPIVVLALGVVINLLFVRTAFAKPAKRGLGVVLAWLPPLWIAYCALRGTRSWIWAVVAFLVGSAVWELAIFLIKRRLHRRNAPQRERPRAAPKSRQRPSVR